jgi:hypothetical protein
MRSKTHWTEFLIDGRFIYRHTIDDIERTQNRIKKLEIDLKAEQKYLEQQEEDIFTEARKQFSIDEITDAKVCFRNQVTLL